MMKKILLISCLSLTTLSFGQNFPGTEVELLLNREIKVLELEQRLQDYGYDCFYKNKSLKRIYARGKNDNSKYASLVGKTFKVTNYLPHTGIYGDCHYILTIDNPETGTLYFYYFPKYEHKFPFEVVGGLDLPEGFYCKQIDIDQPDTTNARTSFTTPYFEGFSLTKTKETVRVDDVSYSLAIRQYGVTQDIGKTGLTLLLENDKKIVRPNAKIRVEADHNSNGYIYLVVIILSKEEIDLLLNNRIISRKLNIYDSEIKRGNLIQEYFKCLL